MAEKMELTFNSNHGGMMINPMATIEETVTFALAGLREDMADPATFTIHLPDGCRVIITNDPEVQGAA